MYPPMDSLRSSSRTFMPGDSGASKHRHGRFDQLGVVASSVCAVHCALSAVILGASSALGTLLRDERLELTFLFSAVALAGASVATSYRRHRDPTVVVLAVAGLALLGAGRALASSHLLETAGSVLGAGLLITCHLLNARLLRRAQTCCATGECTAP
jgi:hypothetical protein